MSQQVYLLFENIQPEPGFQATPQALSHLSGSFSPSRVQLGVNGEAEWENSLSVFRWMSFPDGGPAESPVR